MKYIGNKSRLLDFIYESLRDMNIPDKGIFIDIFSGTTSVAQFFKKLKYKIISNDFMTYSYVFQKTYIETNKMPDFKKLKMGKIDDVIVFLNSLRPIKGYAFDNYAPSGKYRRQYFSDENAMKIDVIRDQIETWKSNNQISKTEFFVLVSSLIDAADFVANISGTYGAYLKIWRSMALKKMVLKIPNIFDNRENNQVFKKDANQLIREIRGTILYLDPPYNSRQYASNFHVLESIAVWDKQSLRGKTGLRDYEDQKSLYCYKYKCAEAFEDLIKNARVDYIVLSYNNEGIIDREKIIEIMSLRGKVFEYIKGYRRFRTERDHEKRKYKPVGDKVSEHLYVVKTEKTGIN